MIGCGTLEVNSMDPEEFFPDFTDESRITIADNILRHAVKLEDVIQVSMSNCDSSVGVDKTRN